MNIIKTIVIDDEGLNRDLVSQLITRIDDKFNVIAQADNIDTAFELINKIKPDVIFLDIKMPNGSGFDLLKRFTVIDFEVVFVTGFDEYAILAFEFNALDYVLKPIDYDKLTITLQKVVKRLYEKHTISNNLNDALQLYNSNTRKMCKISVHHKDEVYLLDIENITSISGNKGYTVFKTIDHKEFMSAKQLSSFEFIFDTYQNFSRINKSTYINLFFLKSYSKGTDCEVTLQDNSVFEISRRKKTEILALIDKAIAM